MKKDTTEPLNPRALTLTTSPFLTPILSALLPRCTLSTCAWKSSPLCRNVMPSRPDPLPPLSVPSRDDRTSFGNSTRHILRNLI